MADTDLPFTQLQMVTAARRHYLDDASKVQIAQELGISRFKVARLLEAAKEAGIVRIEIVAPSLVRERLSAELARRFDLRRVTVVDVEGLSPEHGRAELGRTAAELLSTLVQPTDVLGLPWSRMVSETVSHFANLPPIPIVQLSGALDLPAQDLSPVDVVRDAASTSGGEAHVFYAPLVASDPEAARVIRQQNSVASTLAEAKHCSVAVVGVGGWAPHASTLYDLATTQEREELESLDVVGEIAGTFLDSTGETHEGRLARRLVTLPSRDLRNIPHVIAVSHDAVRAPAVLAGLRGGYITSLVIDAPLAEALLTLSDDEARAASNAETRGESADLG